MCICRKLKCLVCWGKWKIFLVSDVDILRKKESPWLGSYNKHLMHNTSIVELMGSNPLQTWIFSGLSRVHYCDDHFSNSFLKPKFTHMIFIYLQSCVTGSECQYDIYVQWWKWKIVWKWNDFLCTQMQAKFEKIDFFFFFLEKFCFTFKLIYPWFILVYSLGWTFSQYEVTGWKK